MQVRLVAILVFLFAGVPLAAQGTVIVTAVETGGDVEFSSSGGDLNTDAWSLIVAADLDFPRIQPVEEVLVGPGTNVFSNRYVNPDNFTGPSNFGPGVAETSPDSGMGDIFGIKFVNGSETLYVPDGYSGTVLAASSTYDNSTFASLGMEIGSYTWSWGSGGTADSFTLNVVPEPSTAALAALGLIGLACIGRRRAD